MNYLYELINPIDNTVFYIGITNNPKNRLRQHMQLSNKNWKCNPRKTNIIKSIMELQKQPIMNILFEDENKEYIENLECDFIEKMLLLNYPLTNIQMEKYGSYIRTLEIKQKISKALIGRKLSSKQKNKQSKRQKELRHLWSGNKNGMFGKKGINHPSFKRKTPLIEKEKHSITKFGLETYLKLSNKDWCYFQHINLKKSLTQIGFELEIDRHTISKYFKIHNIEIINYRKTKI